MNGVKSVLRIRCMEHRFVGPYNANEAGGGECAACAVDYVDATWAEAGKAMDKRLAKLEAALRHCVDEHGCSRANTALSSAGNISTRRAGGS